MEQTNLTQKGTIFDIQKYSVHDGPGIRTIVFFKGCMFRCRWCCNPESQTFETQNMVVNGKEIIMGREVTVEEVLEETEKDRAYFRRSLGGITLSGGECMCQPKFAKALLQEARERGISTTIETTAAVPFEIVKSIVEETDYVLMDIKHINPKKHKDFIGKDNKIVLENAKKIADMGASLTIRIPVIPTFNATKEEIEEIGRFVKTLHEVKKIHLLPYHRLGTGKYEGLGREYFLEQIKPPSQEQMLELLKTLQNMGFEAQIGG